MIDIKNNVKDITIEEAKKGRLKLAHAYQLIAEYESAQWIKTALRAVNYALKNKKEIGADDIWEILEDYPAPVSKNSMGLVFKIANKVGLIEPSGNYRKTRRKIANGREIKLWRKKDE